MLLVENLHKRFSPELAAVDDVCFGIPEGDITVLLGPSGCGKTTTMRCVAGLEHATAGRITLGGRVVSDPGNGIQLAARHREVGMVFQSYAIWPHMSVRQNVAYPLKNRGLSKAEIDRRVKDALDMVGLSDFADRSSTAMSGGQMQRVALARSMSYSPKLVLLDEPLSNLDAKLRNRLRSDLRRIVKEIGVTALYVTHDQAEAVVIGDHIGVMNKGKLLQMASAHDLYNSPADLFVANFTGATNLLEGTIQRADNGYGVIRMSAAQSLLAKLPDTAQPSGSVTVALRPENFRLGENGPENGFIARVLSIQYQGTQTAYELELFGTKVEAIELGSSPRFMPGEKIPVWVPRDLCWGYQSESA